MYNRGAVTDSPFLFLELLLLENKKILIISGFSKDEALSKGAF
jgi:hypothetical protein